MADLMYAAVLEKSTGEQFSEEFEFDGYIPESTTVSTFTVAVTKVDGTDKTTEVVDSSSKSGTVVTVVLKTLTEETAYTVTVSVVASNLAPGKQSKLLNVTSPGAYR